MLQQVYTYKSHQQGMEVTRLESLTESISRRIRKGGGVQGAGYPTDHHPQNVTSSLACYKIHEICAELLQ